MKDSKVCPKCGSQKVFQIQGPQGTYIIKLGLTSSVFMHRWICSGCGYTEEWISEEELPFLEQFYNKSNHK